MKKINGVKSAVGFGNENKRKIKGVKSAVGFGCHFLKHIIILG
jgi:hypothetical protein